MPTHSDSVRLDPRPVLVVEDEALVAMLLEDMLGELGWDSVQVVATLKDGLDQARNGNFSFAVLDVNLAGVASFPIADVLRSRGIPFIFSTGYGAGGLGPEYADVPTLGKPFRFVELEAVLVTLKADGVRGGGQPIEAD